MDEKYQTSQQKKGEHHTAEGNAPQAVPAIQHGTEDAPTGVPTSRAIKDPFHTTGDLGPKLSTPA